MGDLRPALTPALDAFGVRATIRRPAPDDVTVSATVIWLPTAMEPQPFGSDFRKVDPRRVLAIPRAAAPFTDRGAVIVAPEYEGGPTKTWQVDEMQQSIATDELRVLVREIASET